MVSSRWLPGMVAEDLDRLRTVTGKRDVVKTVYRPLHVLDNMGLRVVVRGINGTTIWRLDPRRRKFESLHTYLDACGLLLLGSCASSNIRYGK
ncbi:hypothetical protein BT96DRAFT_661236 [Gymnopus androsaceus JB14]|uniref:Uncharacterized protein n=1 Tax=Gymnopus androsaceus JB14 TaxID=1447944 RepID=A0A6A4GFY3_9AGAR|nr:hypothetical protein BT96DRAFT_661236 [Gymnopus androsaceus JB14]